MSSSKFRRVYIRALNFQPLFQIFGNLIYQTPLKVAQWELKLTVEETVTVTFVSIAVKR